MIDSHCHINDELYIKNPEQYVNEALNSGVNKLLVVGYDLASSKSAVEIANKFSCVYAAVGIHPSDVKNMLKNDLDEIEKLLCNKKVIAIGEIGLDYYWDKDEKIQKEQIEFFIKQIELANKHNLPISVHCRDAYSDCLNILTKYDKNKKGIIHCYSGSSEMASLFTNQGYLLGIGGTVTFKNAIKIKKVAEVVDRDKYVLETDAPYLTPVPHRGEPNHSKYLSFVRDEIANLKGITPTDVETDTTNNFERLFK